MRGIELFCGLGGFSLAAKRILPNYECVRAADISKPAIAAFKAIHKSDAENALVADCMKVDIPKANIVFAGIPCQAFSMTAISKKGLDDPRRELWKAVPRALELSGAEYCLIEQVPPFSKSNEFVNDMGSALWKMGFIHHIALILDSSDFGVPQRRKRFFCLSSKHPLFQKQVKKKQKVSQKDYGVELVLVPKKPGGWLSHIKFNAKSLVVPYSEPAVVVLHDKKTKNGNYTHMGDKSIRLWQITDDSYPIYSPTAKGLAMLMGHLEYENYAKATIEGLPIYAQYPRLSGNSLVPQCAEFMLSQIFK
jgi:DNA (cytosine-5)-methyltransferase 1